MYIRDNNKQMDISNESFSTIYNFLLVIYYEWTSGEYPINWNRLNVNFDEILTKKFQWFEYLIDLIFKYCYFYRTSLDFLLYHQLFLKTFCNIVIF